MKKGREAALGEQTSDLTGIVPAAVVNERQRKRERNTRSLHFGSSQSRNETSNGVRQFGADKQLNYCAGLPLPRPV
jgi:hypothetical protein